MACLSTNAGTSVSADQNKDGDAKRRRHCRLACTDRGMVLAATTLFCGGSILACFVWEYVEEDRFQEGIL